MHSSRSPSMRRAVALLTIVSLVLPAGCTRQHWSSVGWFPVGRARPSAEPAQVKMVAPESGVYKVKFATRPDASREDLHTYGGARRRLFRGDFIGFSTDASGQVYALAGDELLPLGPRPKAKRTPAYLVWAYKPDAQPQNEFVEALLEAGRFIVLATLAVGVAALWVWAETHPDDECHSIE